MCGIIGIVTTRPRHEIADALTRGTRALAHRGPDDEGLAYLTPEQDELTVAFGQRRLAIIDLSPAGHQPMFDEATGNCITYNGEVFNFQEIGEQFIARGEKFYSTSDTEVLLKGLSRQGNSAVEQWRGMFALGFWQARERRLTLIRDRLGIKPLYYFYDGQTFLFASEVRALRATGLVPRRLSRAAIESYLAYGSVQQPLTIVENVYALLPGHTLTFAGGRITTEAYWQLQPPEPYVTGEAALTEELNLMLLEAIRLRLVADVPIGVFLSGGIDSSAIVSLMRRATNSTIKSFSVAFEEDEFDESRYAEMVARKFNTEHHKVTLAQGELLAKLPRALAALDQPAMDGLNSYIVSDAVAQAGLKVALSGAGGDEVFAGYSFFRSVAQSERYRQQAQLLPVGMRRAAAAAISAFSQSNRANKLSSLLRSEHLNEHSVQLHRRLFTREQQQQLLAANGYAPPAYQRDYELLDRWTQQQLALSKTADAINQASVLDLGGYLSNTLLRDTDGMSMAHSLEVRVPLIDHRLVEFMLRVPGNLKIRPNEPKRLLVNAVGDLPHGIVHRPKRGFELPFKHWLLGELRAEVESEFRSNSLKRLFQLPALNALWRDFQAGRINWSRVWSIYVLSRWVALNLEGA
jgi:asparagine synthase (glutamine-hydrolysing)